RHVVGQVLDALSNLHAREGEAVFPRLGQTGDGRELLFEDEDETAVDLAKPVEFRAGGWTVVVAEGGWGDRNLAHLDQEGVDADGDRRGNRIRNQQFHRELDDPRR